ncbi:MAG: nucleoside triphosphate pyrophosphohydrolase [bacterium]|nr:nucleoside triphosphate pyrophosphohydrolase [bacterium]
MKYGKLVRDRIPYIIREKGRHSKTHVAGDVEYWEKLLEKLSEEVDEFREGGNPEELADILEVIKAICKFKGLNEKEVESIRKKKAEERGGFEERIILDET